VALSQRYWYWLSTADQFAWARRGGNAILGDHLAGDHGGDVPLGGLVEATPARRQVVGDYRLVQPQAA